MIPATNRFDERHLAEFQRTPYVPQAPFNPQSPAQWARSTLGLERPSLKAMPLDRQQVRAVCRTSDDVLDGYLTVMAWGMQGVGKTKSKAVVAWRDGQAHIVKNLCMLRDGKLTRAEAFELFSNINPIAQLGPSYFTKLIHFYAPDGLYGVDWYIMDTWTGKSINLLTREHIVRIQGKSATPDNQPENFEAFCAEVDALRDLENSRRPDRLLQGEQIERMLFCSGAQRGQLRGAWRAYVHANWEECRPKHRYEHRAICARTASS